MTNPNPEQAARILARRKLSKITTGDLPLNPISLVNDIFLSLLGTHESAITIINQIATQEFELVVTVNGELDLPSAAPQHLRASSFEIKYQAPKKYSVILPEMPEVSRKSTKRNSDGGLIDTE